MKPQQGQDPFDLDFEADDDFSVPQSDAWREAPPSAAAAEDPFVDLPPLPDERGAWPASPEPAAEAEAVALPPLPVQETHPVHDMLAGAEAAFGENPVPRITIHIFCAASETAELAERAALDRRMERATVVTRMGGLAAAVELYQSQPTPSLVMVESADPAPQLLALLDRLAEGAR